MSARRSSTEARWYQLPVVWLGLTILLASAAGCIGIIIAAARYPDEPLPVTTEAVLKMPVADERNPGS